MHIERARTLIGLGGALFTLPIFATTPLFIDGDMVRGASEKGLTGPACVLASQFKRGESVVWRVRVRDAQGKNADASMVKSVVVRLPDGQTFPARFGPHPKGQSTDHFWSTSWTVPLDYPTGSLSYTVVATATDGSEHTWSPFKVAMSELAVVPGEVTYTKGK